METVKTTLIIPKDHRLQLDITLPESFPVGEADVVVIVTPLQTKINSSQSTGLKSLAGSLRNSPNFNDV